MKLQFSNTIFSSFFTAGWNVVTKGNSLSAVLCFLNFLFFSGYPSVSRRRLKFARDSLNVVFEGFVLSSLIASPLIKPLFRKEKQRQAYTDSQCGYCGCVALSQPSNYSFALTSMSFRDLPLL